MEQEQLYKEYYPKVLRYVSSKINRMDEAEDLAQNVFVKELIFLTTTAKKSPKILWKGLCIGKCRENLRMRLRSLMKTKGI